MKILTQDRKKVIVIDNDTISINKLYGMDNFIIQCSLGTLGEYDSEESAKVVLERIYNHENYAMPRYSDIEKGWWTVELKKTETLEEISARHPGGLAKELRGW